MYRFVLFLAVLLFGCGNVSSPSPTALSTAAQAEETFLMHDVFRETDAIPGWSAVGEPGFYTPENLFDLVDGQADAFFAYGMRHVAIRRYKDDSDRRLDLEVWELASAADAYGSYTGGLEGLPLAIGNEGNIESGRRLSFWQESFLVQIGARQPVDDAVLRSMGEAIARQLPSGGTRPALIARLPRGEFTPEKFLFFHKEISMLDQLWLGGKNILSLGANTDCLLARYDLNGHPARLLIIRYPSPAQSMQGLAALETARPADMQAAQAQGLLLGGSLW